MTEIDYSRALVEQNRLMAELAGNADWATPVPTCPGWTLLQLIRHVGRGDRWAAQIIREGAETAPDPRQVPDGRPPDEREGALEWLRLGAQAVLDADAHAGPGATQWTFIGPRPAGWWIRRRVHECTVHRADAAIATDQQYVLPAELAADGISEWLELIDALKAAGGTPVFGSDALVRLQATDGELASPEWQLHDHGTARAAGEDDATVRGAAVDLLLALTRRRSADQANVVISGDQRLWDQWLAGTPF
jgi:uncharacterized protein (TIGR03083 family)